MARAKKRTPKVEELRPSVEAVANNRVEKLYGPQGPAWGTPLTAIEDVLLEIREVLTQKKFGSEAGSAAVRQRRAEQWSDGEPLADFWPRRQATATGQRRYRRPAGLRTMSRAPAP